MGKKFVQGTKHMTDVELLIEARALISDPNRWVQNALVATVEGAPLPSPSSPGIARYCMLGAIVCLTDPAEVDYLTSRRTITSTMLLRKALGRITGEPTRWHAIPDYNDSHTHEEVLAVYDDAIDFALGQGKYAAVA